MTTLAQLLAPIPEPRQDARLMVGGRRPPLVLYRTYDENQFWLPFIDSVIFEALNVEPVDVLEQHASSLPQLERKSKKKHAALPEALRRFYVYRRDHHQYVLPFKETRRVSHKEFKRLMEADFPAWDRNREGDTIMVEVPRDKAYEASEWVSNHAAGRVHISRGNTQYVFERSTEAALFKMQFSKEWS